MRTRPTSCPLAPLASLAGENLQKLGLDNATVIHGRFQDNLDRLISENRSVDYLFIDGHHDEHATISYFEYFIPHLSDKAIVVLDDISWSTGMRNAWNKIIEKEIVKFSVDLRVIGICVVDSGMEKRGDFRVKLY